MDERKESRILRVAVERGLLRWEEVRAAEEGDGGDGKAVGERPGWCGPRLGALIAAGKVSAEQARRLIDEVISDETTLVEVPWGSERSDPFFQAAGAPAKARGVAGGIDWGRDSAPDTAYLPEQDLDFLERWDRYEIVSFLGSGGMGRVYKAWDPALKRHVALKFLRWNDPRQLERFLREARSQARVEHENICKVHEAGWVEGHPYIAMQLVDGVTLAEGAELLSLEQKVQVIHDVALAIHSAHRLGLIHRDLKPGNILLERRDDGTWRPCVVDFGLAQDQEALGLTRTGAVTGTPAYLSPEQAQARPVDRRSDVYSLGAVLYELLSGQAPLRGTSLAESLIKVVQEAPPSLARIDSSIPRDLDTIVLKCLEKEPQHRYDSARALADDLERYLDDEPIAARPPSLVYRGRKWVGKNRALAGVIAVALALLLSLGSWSLRARWVQGEREALLQGFTDRVVRAESQIRLASLLPDQDMTRHKAALRDEMEAIRREMEVLGEVAASPGHYALGRGYLALHSYELALRHLEQAWEEGYRRPEVAQGLGRALGVLYQKAILAGGDEKGKVAGGEEVAQRFLGRALAYLREGGEEQGPYAAAMVAFYGRNYQEALARAEEAPAVPWFYEAPQLVGEIHIEMAADEHDRGLYESALAHYDQAGAAFAEALDIGQSDAAVWAGECSRRVRVLALELERGPVAEGSFERAALPCDAAIRIDSELADGYTHKAHLTWRWAGQLEDQGEDPSEKLEEAVLLGQAAIQRNPREVLAYTHLGSAHRTRAEWEMGRGRDPSSHLERAVESLQKAIEIQPALPQLHNNLGNVYLSKAGYAAEAGLDPLPSLDLGIAAYREASRLAPDYSLPWGNLGNALLSRAEHEMEQGLDPKPSILEAIAALKGALELNPTQPVYHNNLGSAALTLGDLQLQEGDDPTESLLLAIASFEKALELRPSYISPLANLAWSHRLLGRYLLGEGGDPSPQVAAARAAIAAALERNPQDAENYLEQARIERLQGEWQARQGERDPEPAFRLAAAALAAGLAINERSGDLHEERASLERCRALWARRQGRPMRPYLERALAAVEVCLQIHRERAEAMALKGCLLHLAADEAAPPLRQSQRNEALSLLTAAVSRNPRLKNTYGGVLAELEAAGAEAGLR